MISFADRLVHADTLAPLVNARRQPCGLRCSCNTFNNTTIARICLGDVAQVGFAESRLANRNDARESSVLLQLTADGPIESRLAFPAAEILAIEAADGSHQFQLGKDCQLSDDKLRLIWNAPTKIEVITAAQIVSAQDAPNSYRHRASNPEQNMFYALASSFINMMSRLHIAGKTSKPGRVKQRGD